MGLAPTGGVFQEPHMKFPRHVRSKEVSGHDITGT